nr:hypothetical protein [Paraflavitalea speifideiaquila]
MFGGKIITAQSFNRMTTVSMGNYGYGLIMDSIYGQQIIGHSGTMYGFLSYDFVVPSMDTHVIILSNMNANVEGISFAINGILFDQEVIPPYRHQEIHLDVKDLEPFVGKYKTDIGEFELVVKDQKLYRRTRGGEMELKAESKYKFFLLMEATGS